ncbi:MAG: hypothetical protein ACRC92_11020 [Peptostreptococcaceae bacterium]
METILKYNKLKANLLSVINRFERRILKNVDLTDDEKTFAHEINTLINKFNDGYIPEVNYVDKSIKEIDCENSLIMDMLDDIGVGYFILLNTKEPLKLIGILNSLEKELSKITFTGKYFNYGDEKIFVKYNSDLKSIGSYSGNVILVNKEKCIECNEKTDKTIIHELVHIVLNLSGLQNLLTKNHLKDINELLCETIAMNNDKYKFVNMGGFSE